MQYIALIEKLLVSSSKIAEGYFGKVASTVKDSDNNQVLTEADLAVGKHIVQRLLEQRPQDNIIDEEAGGINKGSNLTWVIDPIEATSNFAAGTPDYGIMVGLLENDAPIAGGIIVPTYKRLYLAEKGKGATCNGLPIHVTGEPELVNTLVSFGFDGDHANPENTQLICQVLADVAVSARNIRTTGCEAIDPMYVAEGSYGGRICTHGKIWDNVAQHIITQEAGAIYTTASGKPQDYSNPFSRLAENFTSCVASPQLHNQLQAIIKERL